MKQIKQKKKNRLLVLLITSISILVLNTVLIFTLSEFSDIVYIVFYFHVPSAWLSYLAFIVSLVGHIGYLKNRNINWFYTAKNSIFIGVFFSAVTLITGSLWFNATSGNYQGIFWQWADPRQTSTLILFISYLSYLIFVNIIEDSEQKARIGSVLGIFLFPTVPVSYLSAIIFTSLHPIINPNPGEPGNIYWDTWKILSLIINLVAITLFYIFSLSILKKIEEKKVILHNLIIDKMEEDEE
jgi:heme exporter protein C